MPKAFVQLSKLASLRVIEDAATIEGTLETGDSFLTVKNSQGEKVGTFPSSAVDGWWIEADHPSEDQIDLASRLDAARGRLAILDRERDES
jgi:hypothetical protein